jgi:hypothetical protein
MKGDDVVELDRSDKRSGPDTYPPEISFETVRHALLENWSVFTGPTKLPKC